MCSTQSSGPRYDVTKTSGPHLSSTGRIRWKMCRSDDFHFHDYTDRALPKSFLPVLPLLTCCIVLTCLGFGNTRVIRGCGTRRKSKPLRRSLGRPGPRRIFASLDHRAESGSFFLVGKRRQQRSAPYCAQVCWDRRCSVSGENVHPKAPASLSECGSSRDHNHPLRISFALAMVLTMSARRFQRNTHLSSGMVLFTQLVKGYCHGSY